MIFSVPQLISTVQGEFLGYRETAHPIDRNSCRGTMRASAICTGPDPNHKELKEGNAHIPVNSSYSNMQLPSSPLHIYIISVEDVA